MGLRLRRLVSAILNDLGQLERVRNARNRLRRRGAAVISDARTRCRRKRQLPNAPRIKHVEQGSTVETCEVWPTARTSDVIDHYLATVCGLLDRAGVEYFFVAVDGHEQTRIGVMATDKTRIWQTLFDGQLPITTVVVPAGSTPGVT